MKPLVISIGIVVVVLAGFMVSLDANLREIFFAPRTTYVDNNQIGSLGRFPSARPSTSTFAFYTEADWKRLLTPEQYHILREEGTEAPFTSPLLDEHRPGTFVTADCNEPVFRSEQKFDSGTGWPSFWAPIKPDAVTEKTDTSLFEERTEILSKCGGHLGHVFPDGPPPTGLRYCLNGAALKFIPDEQK